MNVQSGLNRKMTVVLFAREWLLLVFWDWSLSWHAQGAHCLGEDRRSQTLSSPD